ncbi:hydrogenase [Tepidibacillus marianensis]|uniref:hydrogenase n=1 Tax=Tepidibacillus marianensis TaxID=3131995 RepID=UPI0030D24C2A
MELISYLLLLSTLLILMIREIRSAIHLLAIQSIFIAALVFEMGFEQNQSHLYWIALFTLIVKALVIPLILHRTMVKINIRRKVERWFGDSISFLIGIALLLIGAFVARRMNFYLDAKGYHLAEMAMDILLMGGYLMIIHKKAIMQGIGFIVMENGIFLGALTVTNGMPFIIELGVFFDLLVSGIIIGIFSFRIHDTFASLNTEKLQKLKG